MSVSLEDLVGKKWLTGVDDLVGGIRFTLDNCTYYAEEDGNDGFRSYMNELVVCDEPTAHNFDRVEVNVELIDGERIKIYNKKTCREILEVGTVGDEYYPSFISEFNEYALKG